MTKTVTKTKPKGQPKPRGRKGYTVAYTAKVQETGTLVSLVDNRDRKFAKDAEPWVTLCEEHGIYLAHPSRGAAHLAKTFPTRWCDACRKAAL